MGQPRGLLRWLYLGRLTVAAGVFLAALLVWPDTEPATTRLVTLLFLLALVATLGGAWHTHLRGHQPGRAFLYGQVAFDTLLVTVVVHVTGGAESDFVPLYILVIAAAALLLPLPGGVLMGGLASALYVGQAVLLTEAAPPASLAVQVVLFAAVALATGYLADRVRRAGAELGEARTELRQLRAETSDILGAMETGVVTVDAVGRLVYLNPAAERLLALPARGWLGRPVLEELERWVPEMAALVRRTAAQCGPIRREEVRLTAGGRERVLGVRTTVIVREDGPWVTIVFQDITDGKRLEELNRRAERLKAVAELAASLAHEIKNPLASIRSAVEQLVGGDVSSEDQTVLRELVVSESDRLSRLLSDFIEFSRVEVRGYGTVDLGVVAREAIGLVRQHPEAGTACIEFAPPEEPLLIEGDADLLHRTVFNLVLNAVQHSGAQGVVRVEVGRISEPELPPGVRVPAPVRLAVRDNGCGIRAEDVPRIFDPFFSTRRGGTGLGLALVHRAVQAHHGAILVDGGPGQGAQFTVYLPARRNGLPADGRA
jgi:two-component system sensor histidine kinase PilS (NtrC family)